MTSTVCYGLVGAASLIYHYHNRPSKDFPTITDYQALSFENRAQEQEKIKTALITDVVQTVAFLGITARAEVQRQGSILIGKIIVPFAIKLFSSQAPNLPKPLTFIGAVIPSIAVISYATPYLCTTFPVAFPFCINAFLFFTFSASITKVIDLVCLKKQYQKVQSPPLDPNRAALLNEIRNLRTVA